MKSCLALHRQAEMLQQWLRSSDLPMLDGKHIRLGKGEKSASHLEPQLGIAFFHSYDLKCVV